MKNDTIVTESFIEEFKTKNGAWTKRQLEILKVSWPPKEGWKRRAIGLCLSKDAAKEFKDISFTTYLKAEKNTPDDMATKYQILEKRLVELEGFVGYLSEKVERLQNGL